MLIRRVTAINFRGIRQAEWCLPDQRFVCLVGPGDSTKTTLLDAIGLVLNPRWTVPFTDADFYRCDTTQPITLRLLIGDLDDKALSDTAYGLHLTGLTADGELEHDPGDGSEPCVLLQLTVDSDLEPVWTVVRHGEEDDGIALTSVQRRAMGLFRVDDRIDTHLRWGRGSALARLTDDGMATAVIAAQRAARGAVFAQPASSLRDIAKTVATAAATIGGGVFDDLQPGWDPAASASAAALLLHNGPVPLTHAGLGSRRLVSIAAQEQAAAQGNILIVDEIEHGLEPHRLIHIIQQLRRHAARGRGQVLLTTHSSVAVATLEAADICVAQSTGGHTTVRQVTSDMQAALRGSPSAILARTVIVCEGATEAGLLRMFIYFWDQQQIAAGHATHAAYGVTFLDGGGGADAPRRAQTFQELGFSAFLLLDNDDPAVDDAVTLAVAAGVTLIRWRAGHSTEDEATSTLDLVALGELVAVAERNHGFDAVAAHIMAKVPGLVRDTALDTAAWTATGMTLEELRQAIAAAAGKYKWFKRQNLGEHLGQFIIDRWRHYETTHLGQEMTRLRDSIYPQQEPTDSP